MDGSGTALQGGRRRGEGGGRIAVGEGAAEVFLPGVVVVEGAARFAPGDVVVGVDGAVVVGIAGWVGDSCKAKTAILRLAPTVGAWHN